MNLDSERSGGLLSAARRGRETVPRARSPRAPF